MTVRQGALQFMMPIDGDKIWQPSLASRRLLEEHLCFWGQKCKEGRKGSKHPCQLLQRVHILICCMLQKCTTFPKTTYNSLGWSFCYKSSFVQKNYIFPQNRNARHFQYAHYTLIVFVLEIQCKLMFCVEVRSFSLEANALGAKLVARLVRALKWKPFPSPFGSLIQCQKHRRKAGGHQP